MLLRELVTATSGSFGNGGEAATTNPQATPLLHHMAAAHAYIQMFVTVNRTGQNDIRNILVSFLFPTPVSRRGVPVRGSEVKRYHVRKIILKKKTIKYDIFLLCAASFQI